MIAPLRDAGQANPSLSSKLTDAVESELSARAAFEVRRQGAAPRGAADATPAARALLVGSHLTLGGTTALSLSVVQVKNGKVLFSATLKLPGAAGADADQLGKMVGTALANHIEGIERAVKKAR
ncbi:MAG: hypothetical protein HYZ28_20160 [Myxococcales bacterium]|nr:hypothetical protein [Myxococcales bacterium]